MHLGHILFCAVLALAAPASAGDLEITPIGKLIENPHSYNLHEVILDGTVESVTIVPRGAGCGSNDAYVLHLVDETGTLEVVDIGACYEGRLGSEPLVAGTKVGDRLTVKVVFSISTALGPNPNHMQGTVRWGKRP